MTDPLILAITHRRADLGWSQTKLGRAVGWFPQQVHAIEKRGGNPRLSTLRLLCDALGCDLILAPKPDVRVSQPGGIWPAEGGER